MHSFSTTHLGAINSSAGGDALGIKSVHVLASGEHIRVPDGISARAREDELAIKGLDKSAELVVSDNLKPDGIRRMSDLWKALEESISKKKNSGHCAKHFAFGEAQGDG
jgi:hypothetical protein